MLRRLLLLCLLLPVSVAAQEAPESPSVELVPFTSPEGARRLSTSYAVDFYSLANQYEPQMNLGTCGPTSAVIVLNALRGPENERRPVDTSAFPADFRANLPPGMEPVSPRYTQRAFFDGTFENIKAKATFYGGKRDDGQRDPGIQLRQLGNVMQGHGLDVDVRIVDEQTTLEQVRNELRQNLVRSGDYVIVNYTRKKLGQPGGGHISPVAAYDHATDSFLILDTNPNRAPWVWVPAEALFQAMQTFDTVENRGFLLVSERQ